MITTLDCLMQHKASLKCFKLQAHTKQQFCLAPGSSTMQKRPLTLEFAKDCLQNSLAISCLAQLLMHPGMVF